jgi:hypothetical protein
MMPNSICWRVGLGERVGVVAVIQFVQLLSSSVTTLVVRRPIELIGRRKIALDRTSFRKFALQVDMTAHCFDIERSSSSGVVKKP